MTVGQLKKILENVRDETLVVVEGYDHSYDKAHAFITKAERYADGFLSEYHGTKESTSSVIDVLVVV